MQLLKLPLVAQIEVYKQFSLQDYFLFSFCSKRAATMVKLKKYRKARLSVRPFRTMDSDEIDWKYSIKIGNRVFFSIGLQATSHYFIRDKPVMLNIGNKRIPIEIRPFNGLMGYCFPGSIKATHAFQKQICNIFSISSKITFEAITDLNLFEHLIPNSINTTILHETPSLEIVEKFYNFHSYQQLLIHQNYDRVPASFHELPVIQQVKNVLIQSVNGGIQRYTQMFQGTNVLFERALMNESWISFFLSQWKEKTNDNLKTFIAYQKDEQVMNRIEDITDKLEPWNTEKHRSVYPYRSIISKHRSFPEGTFDCEGGFYIRRDTDGKIATLKLTPEYFMFFVWK